METKKSFEMILTIVNSGFADNVMDAAKSVGANGGTVLHARGTGIHEAEEFFGVSIQPEKDVVLILVESENKKAIMQEIYKKAGLATEGRGMCLSVPVNDVVGIVHYDREAKL